MSIYALLRNAVYRGQLTVEDVELEGALDGNLCRCTGYKPILDAAKTFVGEYMNGGTCEFRLVSLYFYEAKLDGCVFQRLTTTSWYLSTTQLQTLTMVKSSLIIVPNARKSPLVRSAQIVCLPPLPYFLYIR